MWRSRLALVGFLLAVAVPARAEEDRGGQAVDVNRPHSPFQCDTPIGESWYGSTARCLDELCAGFNVTNEWLFVGDDKRRRRNPCYGRNPTSFDGQ